MYNKFKPRISERATNADPCYIPEQLHTTGVGLSVVDPQYALLATVLQGKIQDRIKPNSKPRRENTAVFHHLFTLHPCCWVAAQ